MSVTITRKTPRALLTEALRDAGFVVIAGPIVRTNTDSEADEVYIMGGDRGRYERGLREQTRSYEEVRLDYIPVTRSANSDGEKKFRGALEGLKRVNEISTGQWRLLRNYSGSDGSPRFSLMAVVEVEQ